MSCGDPTARLLEAYLTELDRAKPGVERHLGLRGLLGRASRRCAAIRSVNPSLYYERPKGLEKRVRRSWGRLEGLEGGAF